MRLILFITSVDYLRLIQFARVDSVSKAIRLLCHRTKSSFVSCHLPNRRTTPVEGHANTFSFDICRNCHNPDKGRGDLRSRSLVTITRFWSYDRSSRKFLETKLNLISQNTFEYLNTKWSEILCCIIFCKLIILKQTHRVANKRNVHFW